MRYKLLILILTLIAVVAAIYLHRRVFMTSGNEPLEHTREQFEFTLNTPINAAAPLFGPEGERRWAGDDWNPHFLYPAPAKDVEGAVFVVPHHHTNSIWVNTTFDLQKGAMQYVYFVPDVLVTVINVRLRSMDANRTDVTVTYERTALKADANEHVRKLATHDAVAGTEWRTMIEKVIDTSAH